MATPKPIEYTISDFYGGVSDDIRQTTANSFGVTKHFDIFSFPKRLVPYRSLETDMNDGSTSTGMKQYNVRDFVYGSASAYLYGLGQNGSGQTKIVYKTDATIGNWTLPASSEGSGVVKNGCLVEYKDYLWGFQGTTDVFKWGTLSSSRTITNTAGTVGTITSVAQGVIASDDNLYLPYNNKIARVTSGGTVNDAVLTLPSNFKINSICNYGKYLAIACAPISTFNGNSKVFLWNLTSPDVQEAIDWGEGELRVLETIEGQLVGVTDRYLNIDTGAGRGSMIIQTYSGGVPQVEKEIFTLKLVGKTMPIYKAVKSNRLFWAAKIMTNTAGTEYDEGLWSFGRKAKNYPYAVTLDIIDENINTSGIQSFGSAGNYFFINHSGDGSIDKTDDAANYNFTSIYESFVFNFGFPNIQKQLLGVSVTVAPIPTQGTLTLKYKKDNDSSWTTIGTYTSTVGTPVFTRDFINIESSSDAFGAAYEYKFRLESTGGIEITSYKVSADLVNSII